MLVKSDFLKKALISAFFVLIVGCSTATRSWKCEKIYANYPGTCSILYLGSENTFRDFEVEIQKGAETNWVFLNVYGQPLQCQEKGEILVTIESNSKKTEYLCHLLEGGQRICLSEDAVNCLFNALSAHTPLTITAGRYSASIIELKFDQACQSFLSE